MTRFEITRRWDGTECADTRLHGLVELEWTDGLRLTGRLQQCERVPEAPEGARVPDLWTYDVVECFLAGDHGYLEVEVGPGGRWLVLGFSAPRVGSDDYATLDPVVRWGENERGWWTSIELPASLVPSGELRANAFVIAGGEHLAWTAVPGSRPDFHQPAAFRRLEARRLSISTKTENAIAK